MAKPEQAEIQPAPHPLRQIATRVSEEEYKAMQILADKNARSVAAETLLAVRAHLAAQQAA